MDERERRILKLVGLRGTVDILRHLDEHGTGQYKDFTQYANVPTLNTRLKQLLEFNLVTHHLKKKELRREWYEITDKGKRVLQSLESIIKSVGDTEAVSLEDILNKIRKSGDVPG